MTDPTNPPEPVGASPTIDDIIECVATVIAEDESGEYSEAAMVERYRVAMRKVVKMIQDHRRAGLGSIEGETPGDG